MTNEPANGSEQQQYFIDSNVLLRIGQPKLGWLYQVSLAFLEQHRGSLVIGPLVYEEVMYQLRQRHGEYQAITDVRHWLFEECIMVSLSEVHYQLATELSDAYAREGWDGVPGDRGDRLHAATATVAHAAFLVTWERRFLGQQALIERVNENNWVYFAPSLIRPDWG